MKFNCDFYFAHPNSSWKEKPLKPSRVSSPKNFPKTGTLEA